MSRSVGIDLVDVAEVVDSLERFGSRYLERVYTEQEIAAYSRHGPACLAACFAAKEATVKALAAAGEPLPWRSIELRGLPDAPTLRLAGQARRLALERGVSCAAVGVSTTRNYAMAVAIVDRPEERFLEA